MKMPAKQKAAAKKATAPNVNGKKTAAPDDRYSIMGYRGHDEAEEHFPCQTFLLTTEQAVRDWATARAREPMHAECGFLIEEVRFDHTTNHIVNRTGNLPDDPSSGAIEWQRAAAPLLDLGPIWDHLTIQDLKEQGMPP